MSGLIVSTSRRKHRQIEGLANLIRTFPSSNRRLFTSRSYDTQSHSNEEEGLSYLLGTVPILT